MEKLMKEMKELMSEDAERWEELAELGVSREDIAAIMRQDFCERVNWMELATVYN